MTATKEVTLWCDWRGDEEGCADWITPGPGTVKRARPEAQKFGWSGSGSIDLCPAHRYVSRIPE